MTDLLAAVLNLPPAERQQLLDDVARETGQRAHQSSLIRCYRTEPDDTDL